jgi:hypothetical protein
LSNTPILKQADNGAEDHNRGQYAGYSWPQDLEAAQ